MKTLETMANLRADERDTEIACKARRIVELLRECPEGRALLRSSHADPILDRLAGIYHLALQGNASRLPAGNKEREREYQRQYRERRKGAVV